MKRSKSLYGNGAGAITPDSVNAPELAAAIKRKCRKCSELATRIEQFKKVIADQKAHIKRQSDFIAKMKRTFREESTGLKVSPLGRAAKRGIL